MFTDFNPYLDASIVAKSEKSWYNCLVMPTREQFEAYVKVQRSGRWNMIMDAKNVAREAGLDLDTYFEVIMNYSKLAAKYKVWKEMASGSDNDGCSTIIIIGLLLYIVHLLGGCWQWFLATAI